VARTEFNNRLRISLIHHDAALEGEVLSYSEIKAAVDPSIISDPSLIPSYEEIRRFDDACNFAAEQAANKKKPFKLGEWIEDPANKHLHVIERVATLHSRFMAIFPWAKESGPTIRIASNLLLQ